MKRKTLEKMWMIIVFILLTSISILGVISLFESGYEKLKYIAAITIISIPINMLMLFLCSNAKD
jgi:hypothetical protein